MSAHNPFIMDESDLAARNLELVELCRELTEALRKANETIAELTKKP